MFTEMFISAENFISNMKVRGVEYVYTRDKILYMMDRTDFFFYHCVEDFEDMIVVPSKVTSLDHVVFRGNDASNIIDALLKSPDIKQKYVHDFKIKSVRHYDVMRFLFEVEKAKSYYKVSSNSWETKYVFDTGFEISITNDSACSLKNFSSNEREFLMKVITKEKIQTSVP